MSWHVAFDGTLRLTLMVIPVAVPLHSAASSRAWALDAVASTPVRSSPDRRSDLFTRFPLLGCFLLRFPVAHCMRKPQARHSRAKCGLLSSAMTFGSVCRPFSRLRLPGTSELHRLHLEILLERELAELAAVSRLLVAAERRQRVEDASVDLDLAGPDPSRDALGT